MRKVDKRIILHQGKHILSILSKLKEDNLDRIQKEAEKSTSQTQTDERFWYPELDKAGNGYAVIRFLPAPEVDGDEGVPFVKLWRHSFEGANGWYIENCRTTIGEKDPVADLNSKLWKMSDNDDHPARKQARHQKRKLLYISNVYIIEDKATPDNEGKVFLYRYGKQVWNKLDEAMHPPFPDRAAFNPFHLFTGANFKLKIRHIEGYQNYSLSEFDSPGPLSKDEKLLVSIYHQEHSLKEFVAPDKFKSYEELERNLNRVLGEPAVPTPVASPRTSKTVIPQTSQQTAPWEEDEDDSMEKFTELAKQR